MTIKVAMSPTMQHSRLENAEASFTEGLSQVVTVWDMGLDVLRMGQW